MALWLPSLLLVLIAVGQMITVFTSGTTPWKRGGFGMFSTIESASNRFISCKITTADWQTHEIVLRDSIKRSDSAEGLDAALDDTAYDFMLTHPNKDKLLQLANLILTEGELRELTRYRSRQLKNAALIGKEGKPGIYSTIENEKNFAIVRSSRDYFTPHTRDPKSTIIRVEVQIWKYKFSPKDTRFSFEPLLEPVAAEAQI